MSLKRTVFFRYSTCNIGYNYLETLVRCHLRSSKIIALDRPAMISYRRSIVTMALSGVVSEINSDFSRKCEFFPPVLFCAPLKEFPWNWVSALGVKN